MKSKTSTLFINKLSECLNKFKDNSTISVGHEQIKKLFHNWQLKEILVPFLSKMDTADRLTDKEKKEYSKVYIELIEHYGEEFLHTQGFFQRMIDSLNRKSVGTAEVIGYLSKAFLSRIEPQQNIYPYLTYILEAFRSHHEIHRVIRQISENIPPQIIAELQTSLISILTDRISSSNIVPPSATTKLHSHSPNSSKSTTSEYLESIKAVILSVEEKFQCESMINVTLTKYLKSEDFHVRKNCVDVCYALLLVKEVSNTLLHEMIKELKYDKIKQVRESVMCYEALYKQLFHHEGNQNRSKKGHTEENSFVEESRISERGGKFDNTAFDSIDLGSGFAGRGDCTDAVGGLQEQSQYRNFTEHNISVDHGYDHEDGINRSQRVRGSASVVQSPSLASHQKRVKRNEDFFKNAKEKDQITVVNPTNKESDRLQKNASSYADVVRFGRSLSPSSRRKIEVSQPNFRSKSPHSRHLSPQNRVPGTLSPKFGSSSKRQFPTVQCKDSADRDHPTHSAIQRSSINKQSIKIEKSYHQFSRQTATDKIPTRSTQYIEPLKTPTFSSVGVVPNDEKIQTVASTAKRVDEDSKIHQQKMKIQSDAGFFNPQSFRSEIMRILEKKFVELQSGFNIKLSQIEARLQRLELKQSGPNTSSDLSPPQQINRAHQNSPSNKIYEYQQVLPYSRKSILKNNSPSLVSPVLSGQVEFSQSNLNQSGSPNSLHYPPLTHEIKSPQFESSSSNDHSKPHQRKQQRLQSQSIQQSQQQLHQQFSPFSKAQNRRYFQSENQQSIIEEVSSSEQPLQEYLLSESESKTTLIEALTLNDDNPTNNKVSANISQLPISHKQQNCRRLQNSSTPQSPQSQPYYSSESSSSALSQQNHVNQKIQAALSSPHTTNEVYSLILTHNREKYLLQLMSSLAIPTDRMIEECLLLEIRKLLHHKEVLKWLKNYLIERRAQEQNSNKKPHIDGQSYTIGEKMNFQNKLVKWRAQLMEHGRKGQISSGSSISDISQFTVGGYRKGLEQEQHREMQMLRNLVINEITEALEES